MRQSTGPESEWKPELLACTQVTVIEFLDFITPSVDSEIRRAYQRALEKQGFKFVLSTKVFA